MDDPLGNPSERALSERGGRLIAAQHDPDFEKRYLGAIADAGELSASLEGPSLIDRLARLPSQARDEVLAEFSDIDLARLRYDWSAWARPKQDPHLSGTPHRILFLLGGRGGGKTIAGANRVRRRVEAGARSIAIVGPTLTDIERYQINGDGAADGLLTVFPPNKTPFYKAHKALIFFHRPDCEGCSSAEECGGAVGYVNSAEKPEFRGPNLDTVWSDEPAKWRYLGIIWHNIELATRLRGRLPLEIILTGTPLPLQLFREIIADEETVTILMKQSENAANLDGSYLARMQRKYGGTRLGRQELEGEILTDNPEALFQASILDATRVWDAPALEEVAVAVDPAIATNRDNDETGIIAGGRGVDGHIYVFADASSRSKPEKWGGDVIKTCKQWQCDIVVGERNRGGDLVASNVRACKERVAGAVAAMALKIVEVHATRGKEMRADPVSSLHHQGMIHIVGVLPELEKELTDWNPQIGGVSPNRLDALVWLVWYLARLGEDEERKPDYRAGFIGLRQASAALRGAVRPGLSGFAAALPRWPGGSKL
jgi:phage terminase large subunit-like protein